MEMVTLIRIRIYILLALLVSGGCRQGHDEMTRQTENASPQKINWTLPEMNQMATLGALLSTRFTSLAAFKEIVQITYVQDKPGSLTAIFQKPEVQLTYRNEGHEVTSSLKAGISEDDFTRARNGNLFDKLMLGLRCPYAVINKSDLTSIEHLGRRRPTMFGKGDVAFYDLAETMVKNIREEDRMLASCEDLTEKGYLNTFNHITAQAFMTSIYSEQLADFVADVHERHNLPELISGVFSETQLADIGEGPVDNYIDMLNNEWGQEIGKSLRAKYAIKRKTFWTAELLADYLNDIQSDYSWSFHIGFKPFRPTDEMVMQFAGKINRFREDVPPLKRAF